MVRFITIHKRLIALLSLLMVAAIRVGAVPVHINSGNPAYPFPQFLKYEGSKLGNLGTQNPEGVVHIEMERDIRIAYQVAANLIGETGTTFNGVSYLSHAYGPDFGPPYDCTEFDGYAMLCAAYMADKKTFDGLWMFTHDYRLTKVKRYRDGVLNHPGYDYGPYVLRDTPDGGAAPDGDYDVALALYVAWKQWGDYMGINDSEGNPISYKQSLLEVLAGIAGTGYEDNGKTIESDCSRYCGSIGFDGYCKSNNHDGETSPWAYSPNKFVPANCKPVGSQRFLYVDYMAPAYFHEFADLIDSLYKEGDPLLDDKDPEWLIQQYRRGEASSDWIMGQIPLMGETKIPFAGHLTIDGNNNLLFENDKPAEDFRLSFRTLLNYVWHGNPKYTWNPNTHEIEEGTNNYLLSCSERMAKFMNSPQASPWNNPCKEFGGGPSVSYQGPSTNTWKYTTDGKDEGTTFTLNWLPSVGTNCAIVTQDYNLLSQLYRQCAIDWDTGGNVSDEEDGATPIYFHGMYKLYGMLISTGNFIAPSSYRGKVNMKVYKSLKDSMTLAYAGDNVVYYLDYRNFGSEKAKDVKIVEHVAPQFTFVSASDGGVYDEATHTITWEIGEVEGFKSDDVVGSKLNLSSANMKKTMGQVSYVVKVNSDATGRKCSSATITCSNGTGWVSNEYPNHLTATMQRNCVDVINRSLLMTKSANLEKVNPGNLVKYTINFENSSKEGWLDGGRPRVNVAMANNGINGQQEKFGVRLYSDAIEPYINYGNYRISYYMYDPSMKDIRTTNNGVGWDYKLQICEFMTNGGVDGDVDVSLQNIVNGQDSTGKKWNQRLIVRFPSTLVTTTSHLSNYNDKRDRVHKGARVPLRLLYSIAPFPQSDVDYTDDWSFDPKGKDDEDGNYYPITPSYQRIDPQTGKSIKVDVDEYLPCICEKPSYTLKNVLVEEYDGYVWRRILGTGPTAGREYENVIILDTLPKGMEFVGFEGKCPLEAFEAKWNASQIADGRWVVKWEIPYMQRNQKGTIVYNAKASFPSGNACPTPDELTTNVAWMSAKNESAFSDTALVTVTCAKVPDPIVPTSMKKNADKENYEVGDDISYEIEYEQTHGFVTKNAAANSSDWTLSGGASVSGGKVTGNTGSKATYKYSYASNIYVEMDCESYNDLSFFFRDNVRVVVAKDWATMTFSCYQGSSLKYSASIVSNANSFSLKVQLTDDVLRLWYDKDTVDLADFTVPNLSTTPGFFGVEAGTYSNIYVHTDYAYDLTIVDRKPAEVEFVSADNGGVLQGDSIVWKFEQGIDHPIPFGTKYNVSWTGKVTECSESIINVAYTKLLGHKDNEIMSQAVSGCGEKCPLPNVSLAISNDEICAGDSAILVAGPTGSYTYKFYENGQLLDSTNSNIFVTKPIAAGRYKYSVEVVSRLTLLPCYSPTDTLILMVNKLPVGSSFQLDPFCKGNADVTAFDKEVSRMTSDGVSYSWFDEDGNPTSQPDINGLTEAGDYKFSYTLSTAEGCKSRQSYPLEFTLREISAPTGTGTVTYLLGDTAANGQFDKNILLQDPSAVEVESGYTYNWFDENGQPLSSAPTPTPQDVSKKIVYGVNRTQPVGCVSEMFPVAVLVSGSAVPIPVNVSYCLNGTAQPITATVSEVPDSNSSWEVVYYDADGNELTSDADRTPSTATAGTITYYVSQREVGNPTNESGKVPLTVTIVEIPAPDISMNRTQYCKGEEYEQLQVKSSSLTLDAGKSSFSWSVDGQSVTGVPLAQTQTSVVQYGVVELYEIATNHTCVSDTAKFAVTTTFVPLATGSLSVNYLKSEAGADGSFESLLTKDPSAVTPSDNSDYELVWFDEALNELGTTDPSPKKDNTWEENKDVKLTYFVKQRHKDSGCLSDTVRITVILSDALVPHVFPMNYCHHAKAVSLENNASINTNNGQVKDIDYELEWFSPEDNYTAPLASAPVPSTETVGVTVYKVAQKHKVDGSVSPKADVKVTVFPNPEIKVDALPQTCGEEIEISKYIYLANLNDTSELKYFSDRNCTNVLPEPSLTASSVFYASAFYTIFSEPNIIGVCASDTLEVNATIDDLTDLVVDAPTSVCPNGDIHLKASATSTTSTVSYEWSGAATGSADVLDTKDESGTFGEVHSYHLTASAGACHLDTTVFVTVGKGELTGDVLANNQATRNLKICDGEPVELSATHEGQDFKWSDLSGGIVSSDKDVSVSPTATTTYVLSFVNKCETSDTVVVEVYPLSLTADFTLLDTSICEKSTASAVLTINGYDPSMSGSYIKWMKNGNELSEFAGQTTLLLNNVDKNDSGEYTYEVSNGICLAKTSDVKTTAQLEVKPYVSFAEPTTVLVPHGGSADLKILGLTPSDATVSWKGDLHDGASNPFTVTDMEKDELFAVTLSADGYCDSETEVQVLVDAKAVVSIAVSADVVCVEDGVTVTADTTGTGHLLYPDRYQLTLYSIDGEGNIAKLSEEGLSIHDAPQSSVSYFAVVTYGDQTATSDTLAVEIVSPAVYTVTEDAVSCSGDEVTIEVSSEEEDVTVVWTEDGATTNSIVVAPTESRSYEFTIRKKGLCPVKDQIPVSVKEKPSVTMDKEKTICEGSDILVSPTVTGKEYSGFEWTDPEGNVVSTDLKLVTSSSLSGPYTLKVETASCGEASASIDVTVIPTPVLYVDSLSFTQRRIEVASGGTGTFEYKMDKQDWQRENLYEDLAYNVLHTAYARDEMGCIGVIAFSIPQPPIPIPDYFTPDGTGTNDVWDVASIMDAYPQTTVKIYDRTGKLLAELDSSTPDWDGTYNGRALPSTDYWYLINVPEIRKQFTGHFTLIRNK